MTVRCNHPSPNAIFALMAAVLLIALVPSALTMLGLKALLPWALFVCGASFVLGGVRYLVLGLRRGNRRPA